MANMSISIDALSSDLARQLLPDYLQYYVSSLLAGDEQFSTDAHLHLTAGTSQSPFVETTCATGVEIDHHAF